jgi:hypothetical protein
MTQICSGKHFLKKLCCAKPDAQKIFFQKKSLFKKFCTLHIAHDYITHMTGIA